MRTRLAARHHHFVFAALPEPASNAREPAQRHGRRRPRLQQPQLAAASLPPVPTPLLPTAMCISPLPCLSACREVRSLRKAVQLLQEAEGRSETRRRAAQEKLQVRGRQAVFQRAHLPADFGSAADWLFNLTAALRSASAAHRHTSALPWAANHAQEFEESRGLMEAAVEAQSAAKKEKDAEIARLAGELDKLR